MPSDQRLEVHPSISGCHEGGIRLGMADGAMQDIAVISKKLRNMVSISVWFQALKAHPFDWRDFTRLRASADYMFTD